MPTDNITVVVYDMCEYFEKALDKYMSCAPADAKLKSVVTPFLDEGAFTDTEWEETRELAYVQS